MISVGVGEESVPSCGLLVSGGSQIDDHAQRRPPALSARTVNLPTQKDPQE